MKCNNVVECALLACVICQPVPPIGHMHYYELGANWIIRNFGRGGGSALIRTFIQWRLCRN